MIGSGFAVIWWPTLTNYVDVGRQTVDVGVYRPSFDGRVDVRRLSKKRADEQRYVVTARRTVMKWERRECEGHKPNQYDTPLVDLTGLFVQVDA